MSLRSMAVMRAEVEERRPAAPDTTLTKIRDQVIALIPAESLAAFLALLSLFADDSYGIRWSIFGVVLLGTPLWVYANYRAKTTPPRQTRAPLLEMAIGMIAFAAWATTVPSTPFLQIEGFDLKMGAAIVAVVGLIGVPLVRILAPWAGDDPPLDRKPVVP